jgi:hypothetical protein
MTKWKEEMYKKRLVVELDVVTVKIVKKNTVIKFNS